MARRMKANPEAMLRLVDYSRDDPWRALLAIHAEEHDEVKDRKKFLSNGCDSWGCREVQDA